MKQIRRAGRGETGGEKQDGRHPGEKVRWGDKMIMTQGRVEGDRVTAVSPSVVVVDLKFN